jgi:hypothetical protein
MRANRVRTGVLMDGRERSVVLTLGSETVGRTMRQQPNGCEGLEGAAERDDNGPPVAA